MRVENDHIGFNISEFVITAPIEIDARDQVAFSGREKNSFLDSAASNTSRAAP